MDENSRTVAEDGSVAVTAFAVRCGLGNDTDQVWKAMIDGQTGVGRVKRIDLADLYCQIGAELDDAAIAPRRRPSGRLDRASKMILATAEEALLGYPIESIDDPYRFGVVLGTSIAGLAEGEQYLWRRMDGRRSRPARLLTYPLYTSADALAAAYDCRGPKAVISNACAAGANAIALAADQLRYGRADVMLAGGVDVLDILSFAGFSSLQALDSEPCAPYTRSSGLNLGEGAALLVLERAERARARSAPILGYVVGGALSSDAHHATAPDPAGSGAVRSMRRALDQAGIEPQQVDYINGHGTGTPANDVSEVRAFRTLFGDGPHPPHSSTKSQIGHNLGAAGAIEVAVCLLALEHQVLPPTINVDPDFDQAGDIVANTGRKAAVSTVMSNSFAFGGNNCSVLLSAEPGCSRKSSTEPIVVTGMGVISPFGLGWDALVAGIEQGRSMIASDDELAEFAGSTLRATLDDSHKRSIDRRYLRRLDQVGALVLAASRMALQDAGLNVSRDTSDRIGMIFGTCTGPIETVTQLAATIKERGPARVNPKLFPNSVMNAAAGHACLSLSLRGPLSTLATGCVAGLSAVGYACDLLRDGEADVMLAVAADEFTPMLHAGFDDLNVLTSTGVTPYDRRRSGTALGSGAVCLVLERLNDARYRASPIHGEIRASATTADAFRIAGNNPDGAAWAQSMHRAITASALTPADIGVVYGDARGTEAIDRAELAALGRLWSSSHPVLANLTPLVGHIHSTTPMLSLVAALTSGRRIVPPVAVRNPEPGVEPFLDATGNAERPRLVTAANWGGTYTSTVIVPG